MNRHREASGLPYLIGALTIAVISIAVASLIVVQDLRLTRQRMDIEIRTMARILAEQVRSILSRTDGLLHSAEYYYSEHLYSTKLDRSKIEAYLAHQRDSFPGIRGFTIFDESGLRKFGTDWIGADDVSDRPYFMTLGKEQEEDLLITGPFLSGEDDTQSIILARRITNPDSSFHGIIECDLDTRLFSELLYLLKPGDHELVELRTAKGNLIAYNYAHGIFDRSEEFMIFSNASGESSSIQSEVQMYTARLEDDAKEYQIASVQTGEYPFQILVGRSTEQIFVKARSTILQWIAICVLCIGASSGMAWMLFADARRRIANERRMATTIEELEKASEALQRASQEQQAILDTADIGIVVMKDRHISHCNRSLEVMLGYNPGELIGKSALIMYAEYSIYEILGRDLYATATRGETYSEVVQLKRADGTCFWSTMSARAIDPEDISKGIVGTQQDITERRKAEEALRLATMQQKAFFDAATVGIVFTRSRTILTCNRTMEKLFGYEEGGIIGKDTRVWYPDEATYERIGGLITSVATVEGIYTEELQLSRKDGSLFWARLAAVPLDPSDLDKGIAGTFEDISSQREALAAMATARRMAEDAARTKADFLANMSHEIRTPMNAIIGMTQLALKTGLSPKQRDYMEKIRSSSLHLLGVINDILDFSKIETGKLSVERIDFDLEQVIDGVVVLVADRTSEKGLELIVDIEPGVPLHLVGDPLRLNQILINYTSNAVKFTEHGEVAIHITLLEESDTEVLVRFAVRDTGVGIDEAQQAKLFQSFQQADTSITRKYGGSGLGLVISRQLAELMGGKVGFASTLGEGSTFWFTARLGKSNALARPLLPGSEIQGRRMLVVDDNDEAREVLESMLRSMTFEVTSVASGPAALVELDSAERSGTPYDLALLDWKMPIMDGVDTAAHIRSMPLGRPPHLLMLTGYGREDVLVSAGKAGIEDVLVKPVTPSQLFDTVVKIFSIDENLPSAAAKAARYAVVPTQNPTAIAGARVLLVEDNELNQEIGMELLKDIGLEVELAEDGSIALKMLRERSYDLVLMDMQMPVMDGITATREIRKNPDFASLPIVAMTANAMADDRDACLAAGMNDHLAKPIDQDRLIAALLRWIRKPKASGSSGSQEPGATISPVGSMAASPATPVDLQACLGKIPGLDSRKGIEMVMSREDLYRRLLTKYIEGQAMAPGKIAGALATGDRKLAMLTAHSLKGTSAQVCATAIRMQAEAIEHAIRDGKPSEDLSADIAELSASMQLLVRKISACLA